VSDVRDRLVIEMLADSEAELLDRVVDMTLERDTYRDMAKLAIEQLHDQFCELEYLRRRVANLCDEIRALRDQAAA